MGISSKLPGCRKGKRRCLANELPSAEEEAETGESEVLETESKRNVFFTVIDSVTAGFTTRYREKHQFQVRFPLELSNIE